MCPHARHRQYLYTHERTQAKAVNGASLSPLVCRFLYLHCTLPRVCLFRCFRLYFSLHVLPMCVCLSTHLCPLPSPLLSSGVCVPCLAPQRYRAPSPLGAPLMRLSTCIYVSVVSPTDMRETDAPLLRRYTHLTLSVIARLDPNSSVRAGTSLRLHLRLPFQSFPHHPSLLQCLRLFLVLVPVAVVLSRRACAHPFAFISLCVFGVLSLFSLRLFSLAPAPLPIMERSLGVCHSVFPCAVLRWMLYSVSVCFLL